MKKLALSFSLLAAVIFFGCTAPQQRIAVNTLATTHVAVDTAVATYFGLVMNAEVPTNGVPAVARDYREFQRVFNVAVDLVEGNTNATAPQIVLDAAAKVISETK